MKYISILLFEKRNILDQNFLKAILIEKSRIGLIENAKKLIYRMIKKRWFSVLEEIFVKKYKKYMTFPPIRIHIFIL